MSCIVNVNQSAGLPMATTPPLWKDRDIRRAAKLAREQGIIPDTIEVDCRHGIVRVIGTPNRKSVELTAAMKPPMHQRSGEA
jgi:hypothetical protein